MSGRIIHTSVYQFVRTLIIFQGDGSTSAPRHGALIVEGMVVKFDDVISNFFHEAVL